MKVLDISRWEKQLKGCDKEKMETETITAYFGSFEAANNYLHNWVMGDENLLPFNYEYYTRHYNLESGCRYNTWGLVEMGSNETLKFWSVMLGVANA